MVLLIPTWWGFPSVEIGSDDGLIIIIRDRAQQDKVVKVIEPLDTVYLTFDWENDQGRLHYIQTEWENYNSVGAVSQLHKLYYEDYLTSYDEVESVLTKVRQITKITKKYMDGIIYSQMSAEREQLYKSIFKEIETMNEINKQRTETDENWRITK